MFLVVKRFYGKVFSEVAWSDARHIYIFVSVYLCIFVSLYLCISVFVQQYSVSETDVRNL